VCYKFSLGKSANDCPRSLFTKGSVMKYSVFFSLFFMLFAGFSFYPKEYTFSFVIPKKKNLAHCAMGLQNKLLSSSPDFLVDGKTFQKDSYSFVPSKAEPVFDIVSSFFEGILAGCKHIAHVVLHPDETIAGIARLLGGSILVFFRIVAGTDTDCWGERSVSRLETNTKAYAKFIMTHVLAAWGALSQLRARDLVKHSIALLVEFYITGKILSAAEEFAYIVRMRKIIQSERALTPVGVAVRSGHSSFSHATEVAKFFANHGRNAMHAALRSSGFSAGYYPIVRASLPVEYTLAESPLRTQYNIVIRRSLRFMPKRLPASA
jgi:hypothetical protein